jgi:hypothetical protein
MSDKVESIAEVHTAFPKDEDGDRDFRGHRHYHTKLISDGGESGKFWSGVKEQVAKNVVIGLLMVFMLGVNSYITNAAHTQEQHK